MFLVIYITFPNEAAANEMADHLLEKKIIACANIFPITSAYWWQGKIEREGEFVALVKTQTKHWETLEKMVTQKHPYDTPCIMRMEVAANQKYEQWIIDETGF